MKKFFIKLVKLFGYEIIDQNNFISPTLEKNLNEDTEHLEEIEKKIVKVLDQKVRPAVAKDGGDIKFKEFKNGVVKVQLQGSC